MRTPTLDDRVYRAEFALGLVAVLVARSGSAPTLGLDLSRGLPVGLLAVAAALAAAVFGLRRIYGHALVLTLAAILAVTLALDPGWSLLGAGTVLAATAVVLLSVFVRARPFVRAG